MSQKRNFGHHNSLFFFFSKNYDPLRSSKQRKANTVYLKIIVGASVEVIVFDIRERLHKLSDNNV